MTMLAIQILARLHEKGKKSSLIGIYRKQILQVWDE